ncbi:MAG: TolC family protein [Sandaracinaceae bacterium]|nr:TolC family protein [Sandaracinaceae bacterium]
MYLGVWLSLPSEQVQAQADEQRAPVVLEHVLRSTVAHHPSVQAALAREDVAEAELMRARGAFDPALSVRGALRHGGYYELRRVDAELRAPTPWLGAEFWAGYRYGRDVDDETRYPGYYSDQTLDRGELRAGVRVPLLRDRALDDRRAVRARAELAVDGAQQVRALALIELERRAAVAYWSWVAAGRGQQVCEELLVLAEVRLGAVRERVASGIIPEVDTLEAERAWLSRQDCVIQARRNVEAAAIVLGLFLRSDTGAPAPPTPARLPRDLPLPPAPVMTQPDVERVLACHPRIAAQRAVMESQRVARDLASQRRQPRLDALAEVSRDLGQGDATLPGTVLEVGVQLSVPLALRDARGQHAATEAQLAAERELLRLAEDEVRAELSDIASAYQAALERHALLTRLEQNAEQLAAAERRQLELGATSLLFVNIREQGVAEASLARVQAVRALWEQALRWQAATRCE